MSHLTIVARPENGFCRAGFHFSADNPKHIALADLSEDQIQSLKSEKNLVVVESNGTSQAIDQQSDVEIEALKKQTEELKAENSKLNDDLAKLDTENGELEAKLKDRTSEIKALKKQVKELEDAAKKSSDTK